MKFNKTILPGGLRIITVPMSDNPSVTVLVMVEAGSEYETKENNGISHFLEHMVFKGTTKRPKASDISRELDSIGAHYNAFTTHELTGYYAKADSRHFGKILDIISDMYNNPLFDPAEMEKEKGVIVEEIRMYQDLPQQHVQDLVTELIYGDQPAGWNIAGTENNVRKFTKDDLVRYRQSRYVGAKTTAIISGSFDEKTIIAQVTRAFDSLKTTNAPQKLKVQESQNEPKILLNYKETDQTHLVIGVRTFPIADRRSPILSVLSTILGRGMSSRLFSKMRDQLGICYYIGTGQEVFTDHGFLSISAGVDNSRVLEALKGIIDECDRMKSEIVPDDELKKAKDYISGTTMLELETSEARAEYCGFQELLKKKIEEPEDILAKIQAVTAEEVQKLAKEIFVNQGLNLAMVGRSKDEEILKNVLRFEY